MTPTQSLSSLTSKLLIKLESHFKNQRPDLILAHGDTTTSLSIAISSFYHQIPFFHAEAGLRTYQLNSPFPEEFNRQMIAPIASHHFAPTIIERENLLKDGIPKSNITVTGSTIHDAVRSMRSNLKPADETDYPLLKRNRPLVVVILHRREMSQNLEKILLGIKIAATNHEKAVFICPIHPNPKIQKLFRNILGSIKNIILTEPLSYPQFISLLLRAKVIITDSGGVQEEAVFLGKKVLLARTTTERRDGIQEGLLKIMGQDTEQVVTTLNQELNEPDKTTLSIILERPLLCGAQWLHRRRA